MVRLLYASSMSRVVSTAAEADTIGAELPPIAELKS